MNGRERREGGGMRGAGEGREGRGKEEKGGGGRFWGRPRDRLIKSHNIRM